MSDVSELLRRAQLNGEQRLLVLLCWIGPLTETEAADELNDLLREQTYTRDRVAARLRTARRRLIGAAETKSAAVTT